MTFTPEFLDALEKPVRKPRFGKAVKGGPSERVIQRQIVAALRKLGILVHHSPNGSHLAGDRFARVKQTAALKADGMMAGFPDLLLIRRNGEAGFLEVKAPGGKLEASQEALFPKLQQRSSRVAVVTSLDEALDALRGWQWL
jgi:hypothetical protein